MSSARGSVRKRTDASTRAADGQSPAWASPSGLVLITSLLVGGVALLVSALMIASTLTNSTEWALFVLTLVVLTPAAVAGGRWLAQIVDAAAGRSGLAELAALAAVGILGVVLAARGTYALGHRSSPVMLVLALAWAAALVWAARRLTRDKHLLAAGLAERSGGLADPGRPAAWVAIAGLAGVGSLAFFPANFFHAGELAVSLVLAAALLLLHLRRRPAAPRRAGLLLDAAVAVLVIMVVTDVSGYLEYLRPDARTFVLGDGRPLAPSDLAAFHRIHEGFFLAPLNDMLHGRPLLVDTTSQYGVGVFYFLAGFFQIAPLGYGALGLLSSFVTGLQFALAYAVLRLAGVARTLAIPVAAAALLGLVMGSLGSYNDYPSTGGLRFGIPWLIVVVATLAARRPQRPWAMWAAAIVLVACASVWSFETFAYAGATYAAAVAFEAGARQRGRRLRMFATAIATALGACVVAHVLLAICTRVFAGAWPDWSTYLAYLNVYSDQSSVVGVTVPWTPGLALLFVHLASLICLAGLVARSHPIVLARRPALTAIAACNGLGIASYSYWVGISISNALFFMGLPVVVVVALWLSVAHDTRARVPAVLKLVALAAGLWFAATLAISGWQDTEGKWRRTALAHAIPKTGDDDGLPDAVSRLWHNPPSDPRSLQAQRLLDRHLRPGKPALVLMEPELTVETLVRSGRINVLPISHPEQENLVPDHADPRVIATVDALQPGTLMLTQPAAWNTPVKPPAVPVANGLVRVQRLALDRIRARFRLQVIDQAPAGLAIVSLRPTSERPR